MALQLLGLVLLVVLALQGVLGKAPLQDNRLQHDMELDMGSPTNLAATAVAAALEGEDDFGFDAGQPAPLLAERVSPEQTLPEDPAVVAQQPLERDVWSISNTARVQRFWGIPDTSAMEGFLFTFPVPADAFSGEVDSYEASTLHGAPLPKWLIFKPALGQFEGVPNDSDLGELYIKVTAQGLQGDIAKDVFAINVASKASDDTPHKPPACSLGQDRLMVSILVDAQLNDVRPQKRVSAIRNLAGFLGISADTVELKSQEGEAAVLLQDDSVVAAGAGNTKRPRTPLEPAIVLRFPSTCATPGHALLLERLQSLAKDGTLAEVLQLPVIGWLAQATEPQQRRTPAITKPATREKRQIEGSGSGSDYYDGDEDLDEEEEDSEDDEVTPQPRDIPTMASPTFPEPTATTPRLQTDHPHRHGHGGRPEQDLSSSGGTPQPSSVLYPSIMPTPVLVPIRPTRVTTASDLVSPVFESMEPSRVGYDDFAPAPTPSVTPGITPTTEEDYDDEDGYYPSSRRPTSGHVTEPLPPYSSSSTPTPPHETTTGALEPPPSSTEDSTSTRPQPEVVEFDSKNFAPRIKQRLQKIPAVAGKALRYIIPENSFEDFEDGTTRNLRLIFKSAQGTALPSTSWIQFNAETQEIYALPLEEHVSKWNFEVEAMDNDGKTVSDSLEVVVQQHKGSRTINHEFTLELKIEQRYDFPSSVDWQLSVLNGLARFFGDPNDKLIIVVNATSSTASDKVYFTWTNDSLPRSECDKTALKQMYDAMTINDRGEPSMAFKEALGSAFQVKHVTFKGLGQCEYFIMGPTPAVSPKGPVVPPPNVPMENFAPALRNQVDHLNATVGQLLVFRVPEDTFYDPEDGSTRNMKLSLLTMNLQPVDPEHWLQFDVKNQEFYGVPQDRDRGQKEYQLVCEDNGGLKATDGLVVVVHAAPPLPYNVEFRMTLAGPTLDELEENAASKRRLMERLGQLFGDSDARHIMLAGLRPPPYQHIVSGPNPAVEVSWYNKSLPRDICPEDEVAALRKMLIAEDAQSSGHATIQSASLGGRVAEIMKTEFPVLRVAMVPTGLCQGELTFVHAPLPPEPPSDDDLTNFGSTATSDEYLITYIVPAVVIAAMLLLAGLVACALYRRKSRGKLAVGESGPGTPGFRTRGIPVIFQDELDEKAVEPVAKKPIIMKNEKPPLPPPEYPQHMPSSGHTPHATPPMHPHRQPTAEDPLLSEEPEASPYQPPPPFTSNRDTGRQNRPKPTPTYRKPPPYVPP